MLARSLDTHSTLGQAKDRQWITNAMSFLRAYALVQETLEPSSIMALPPLPETQFISDELKASFLTDLLGGIKTASEDLEERQYPSLAGRTVAFSTDAPSSHIPPGSSTSDDSNSRRWCYHRGSRRFPSPRDSPKSSPLCQWCDQIFSSTNSFFSRSRWLKSQLHF